jgi:hypothetical protein
MRCYYKDEEGKLIPFDIPDEICDHCNEDLWYIEADTGRASVACSTCDFQMWVYPPDKNGKIKRLLPGEIEED